MNSVYTLFCIYIKFMAFIQMRNANQNEPTNQRIAVSATLPADFHIISEQVLQFIRVTARDPLVQHILQPIGVDEAVAELPREGSDIAEETRTHQTVTNQLDSVISQLLQVLLPPVTTIQS